MIKLKIQILILLTCLAVSSRTLYAQKSESEVQIEEKLIDANKEKLLGHYDKSIEILREAKKLNRDDDAIAYELGVVYNLNDDPETAIKMFNDAIRLDPGNPWYYKHLAAVYQETGNFGKAVELYQSLINLEPDNPDNYYRKAYFEVLNNDVKSALITYDLMEQKFGFNEKIARRKHSLYVGNGELKKAAHEFEKLITQEPTNVEYRLALAEFYEAHNQPKKAKSAYEEIIKIDPDNPRAKVALTADYNPKKRDETNYINSLKALFAQKNVDIDLKISKLYPIIQEVAQNKDTELAAKGLELSAILEQTHPEEAKAYAVSGDFLYFSNQLEPALKKYQKTLELNKNNFIVWENVMNILWELKQVKQLRQTSEDALDLFPNKAIAYYMYALAANEEGDGGEALNMLQQAVLMTGKNPPLKFKILVLQGDIYCKQGKNDKATKAYDKAAALNPDMRVERKCKI